jgi:hypothetical protein
LDNIISVERKKTVSMSIDNYMKLKRYGLAGDSFNSVMSKLFQLADKSAAKELQEKKLDGVEQSSNLVETSVHLVNGEVNGK